MREISSARIAVDDTGTCSMMEDLWDDGESGDDEVAPPVAIATILWFWPLMQISISFFAL